ncbi:putative membrane protein YphA (DoxX/SURF4 family) [Nocardia tenerifensis]|uniref:Putative membrane protein YphA (DoxX/SURF4 family) n=1 Tax=Nocardia tenerifensis TaxID=228006 RepID=A0A318KDG3_9NOCA|nr:DoxX family protein [Nocardia tenerifensis]PXX69119.1 putative membrane protein YphA (DoxX/SURF4 family) [Nocardia tenerifensis]
MLLRRLARPLLATVFVVEGVDTLRHPESRVKAATELVQRGQRQLPEEYAAKLPSDPGTVVRINAGAQVAGGVLLALGKAPRLAALVLAATVVPATVTEQDFWNEADPAQKATKRKAFLKDLGLLGGLMIASADTEGKPSLGWRGKRAARDAAATVTAALPFTGSSDSATGDVLKRRAHEVASAAGSLGSVAAAKGSELAETVQQHGPEWAAAAKEHTAPLAETAKERGAELAEIAKHRGAEFAELAKERGPKWVEFARERGAELAELARERGAELADVAKHRGAEWAELAKERGAEFAEVAKERSAELADTARDRGPELADTARKRGGRFADSARHRVEKKLR